MPGESGIVQRMTDVSRLVFGLVAAAGDGAAATRFEELAAWMKAHAALDLERRTAPTYYDLAMSVRQSESDVAWLPPVSYAWLAEAVTPLGSIVRDGRTSYSSALVVPAGSAFRTLHDLQGARAAWVDPWSAAGYVVPRLELAAAGIDPRAMFRAETFHGSHREVLAALGRGECDVAGTYARTRYDGDATVEGAWSELPDLDVRVLTIFGSIPPDVLVVRRSLAPAPYERALAAFRAACADEGARPLVRALFGGDELREGIEPGHATLRFAYEGAVANGLFDD